MTVNNAPRAKWHKVAIGAGLGAVAGFFGSIGLLWLSDSGLVGTPGPSEEVAGLVGLLYLLTAAAVGFGVTSPAAGARFLNVEDADELREQRRLMALSALSLGAAGVALIVLALAGPGGILSPVFALSSVVLLLAIAVVIGIIQSKAMDEMMRRLSLEAASLAFYLVALIGGGWAALAHLGFVEGPDSLDWLAMFAGLQLVAAFVAGGRMGILAPR